MVRDDEGINAYVAQTIALGRVDEADDIGGAVFAPLFRYFDILDPQVSGPIFEDLPRVSAWRAALAIRPSIIDAVGGDYADRFLAHLRHHGALLAA